MLRYSSVGSIFLSRVFSDDLFIFARTMPPAFLVSRGYIWVHRPLTLLTTPIIILEVFSITFVSLSLLKVGTDDPKKGSLMFRKGIIELNMKYFI